MESYLYVEMQLVYSAARDDWTLNRCKAHCHRQHTKIILDIIAVMLERDKNEYTKRLKLI